MKRVDFNELIEKAFSMGYERAQKEFGAVKRENKKKKREWEIKSGNLNKWSAERIAERKFNPNPKSKYNFYSPTAQEIDSIDDKDIRVRNGRGRRSIEGFSNSYQDKDINKVISEKARRLEEKGGRQKLKEYMDEGKRGLKRYKEGGLESIIGDFEGKVDYGKSGYFRRNKETKALKKKAALIGAGILGTGIAAYAGKKAYNKYKAKKQKEQEEKENKNK